MSAVLAEEDLVIATKSGQLRGTRTMASPYSEASPMQRRRSGRCALRRRNRARHGRTFATALRMGRLRRRARSRLAHVMGDFEQPHSEDCLTLTVWTPAADSAKRPVLVWIHGGAFSSGAGSLPWYSGEQFAARDDIVAVSINYRLGALGFLYLPGISGGNLGLLDQIAALRFVRENIAAFGGDPDNITVVGQSAGAASIAILLTMPEAQGLFRRAIMQSTPFGRMSRTSEDAHRIGRRLFETLGLDPKQRDKAMALPAANFVAAQGEIARGEKKFADAQAPFGPVIDGKVYARRRADRVASRRRRRGRHHDRHDTRGNGGVLQHRSRNQRGADRGRRKSLRIDVQERIPRLTTMNSARMRAAKHQCGAARRSR